MTHCITNSQEFYITGIIALDSDFFSTKVLEASGRCLSSDCAKSSNTTGDPLFIWTANVAGLNNFPWDGTAGMPVDLQRRFRRTLSQSIITANTTCAGPIANPTNSTYFSNESMTSYCDYDVYPKAVDILDIDVSDGTNSAETSGDDQGINDASIFAIIGAIVGALVVSCIVLVIYKRMRRTKNGSEPSGTEVVSMMTISRPF